MKVLRGFVMCQSMFCALPCRCRVWKEEARTAMVACLPIVGVEIGLLWAGLWWLCSYFALPQMVTGFLLCAVPYVLTGKIHLDGFMDVCDAVGSCRDLEKRRNILKDPHVGSFAVIGLGLLLLAGFACAASGAHEGWILAFVPVVSRCCSALAVLCLKPMSTSQYAGRKKTSPLAVVWLVLLLIGCVACGFVFFCSQGFVPVTVLAVHGLALLRGYRSLGGMNGDISGYALTLAELAGLAAWALM